MNKDDILCFVSMPRSGTHWFRCMAELVLLRKTLPYGSDQGLAQPHYTNIHKDDIPWGTHYHGFENNLKTSSRNGNKYVDFDCTLYEPVNKKILYLSRNIINVVYSWCVFGHYSISPVVVKGMATMLKEHHRLFHAIRGKEMFYFTYEEMRDEPMVILPKVFDFIGMEYTIESLKKAVSRATKGEVAVHNRKIADPTPEYGENRKIFTARYSDMINEI